MITDNNSYSHYNTIQIPVIITDLDQNIIFLNNSAEETYSWSKEELIGKNIISFVIPLEKQYIKNEIDSILLKGNSWTGEFLIEKKKGTKTEVEGTLSTLIDNNNKLIGVIAVINDTIEKKKNVELLNQKEENLLYYFNLFNNINDAIISTDNQSKIILWNKAAETIYGWKAEDVIGKFASEVITTKYLDSNQEKATEDLNKNNFWNGEVLQLNKNNELIPVFSSVTLLKDKSGKVIGTIAINRDITNRKIADLKNAKLYKAVEHSPASIVITDIEGKIEYVNPKFTEVTGYSLDETIGQNPRILKSGKMSKEIYKGLWDTLLAGNEWRGEILNKKKNGDLYWEFASISAIKNAENITTNYVAVKEDISDKKKIEETQLFLLNYDFVKLKENFFESIARFLAEILDMDYVCIDKLHPNLLKAQTIAIYFDGKFDDNVEYTLLDTPCGDVVAKSICFFPNDVRHYFPKDIILQEMVAESYIGTTFLNSKGEIFGLIAVIGRKPLKNRFLAETILKIVAIRAAGELERWQSEELLIQSEEKFRSIAENLTDVIFTTDFKGIITYISPASSTVFGFNADEMQNQFFGDFLADGELEKAYPIFNKALKSGVPSSKTLELKAIRKNDKEFFIELKSSVIKKEGHSIGTQGVIRDITERNLIETERKQNEKRLKSLVDILQYNTESIQNLLEFTLEEAIKLTISKIGYIYFYDEKTHEFTLNSWSKGVMKECSIREPRTIYQLEKTGIWGEAVRQKKPIILNNFEEHHPLKKGYPEGHASLHKFLTLPVISENRIVAVIGVGNKETDYTETDILQLTLLMDSVWKVVERKQFEIELKQKNRELVEINATKDKLFSIIAHDLKNPFSSILGFSELLIQNTNKYNKEKILKFSNYIYNSTNNAYKLLENLLEWSKIQRDTIKPNYQNVILKDITDEIIKLLNEMSIDKNIVLKNKLNAGIIAKCDIDMTKTIMRNLISNAIKYTDNNGLIIIDSSEKDKFIEVEITDNGVGISEQKIEQLFRIDINTSTKGTANEPGTGLGLLLCKELVEMQGGSIKVESTEGKGSTFYFTLPKI